MQVEKKCEKNKWKYWECESLGEIKQPKRWKIIENIWRMWIMVIYMMIEWKFKEKKK
jgi:hypothetical protein